MATEIMSDIEKFGSIAHELVERLRAADGFKWYEEIGPLTIDLELARQSWLPSRHGDDEPAFLILEASSRDRRPEFSSPMLTSLSTLVHGQLGNGVTRLAVMFYRMPDESKCLDKLLSVTNQGKHLDFHPVINRQTAIRTVQNWIDFVARQKSQ